MSETFQEALSQLNELKNYETFSSIPYSKLKDNLDSLRQFLDFLGNPQEQYLIIHVAGTKGKGSVCLMLDQILRQEKYCVGLFTSPHFHSLMERFCINGQPCDETFFAQTFFYLQKKWEEFILVQQNSSTLSKSDQKLTFFEWTVLIAFELFARAKVQLGIIETGLGGRWDATNICSATVSVITSISFDHQEQLGSSLLQIASEKAGIIKKNVPVVSGVHFFPFLSQSNENIDHCLLGPSSKDQFSEFPQKRFQFKPFEKSGFRVRNPNNDEIITKGETRPFPFGLNQTPWSKENQTIDKNQYRWPEQVEIQQLGQIEPQKQTVDSKNGFKSTLITQEDVEAVKKLIRKTAEQQGAPCYQLEDLSDFIRSCSFSILGEHQKWNAEIAWTVLSILKTKGINVSENNIRTELKRLRLPGRIEIVSTFPLLILDGAHNRASAAALMKTLNDQYEEYHKTLLFATTIGKDVSGMIAELFPYFDKIILTEYKNNVRALPLLQLEEIVNQTLNHSSDLFQIDKIESNPDLSAIVIPLFQSSKKDSLELYCATGSFYFIAQIEKIVWSLSDQ
ncbi:MAG: Mur ligase family protein [Planctomycetia bacterium]|nr:Mur ligase family protein [Planctomycetia bacterium]